MTDLSGKTVLVTGAKGGLGAAVTQAFLDAGSRVVGVSRSIEAKDFPHPCFFARPAELSNGEAARALIDAVVGKFEQIDVLAHLVGGFAGGAPLAETDDATFARMIELNLISAFHVFRAVAPPMRRQGTGRIIAIGGRTAVEPVAMSGAYNASKAALVSLVRTLALENADRGITANIVLPGTMDTPANRAANPNADFAQWVQPAHVAAMLVHLASDAGSAMNGAVIPIYGLAA